MSALPMETTAPAGYACPVCQDCLFPAENIVSPVADELRSVLKEVNWARAGLGMSLLPSTLPKPQHLFSSPSPPLISSNFDTAPPGGRVQAKTPPPTGPRPAPEGESVCLDILQDGGVQHSSGVGEFGATSRKQLQAALPTSPLLLAASAGNHAEEEEDHDENKYKRRSALRFLVRWWRSVTSGRSLNRMSMGQRYLTYGVAAMLTLITLLVILTHLSGMLIVKQNALKLVFKISMLNPSPNQKAMKSCGIEFAPSVDKKKKENYKFYSAQIFLHI